MKNSRKLFLFFLAFSLSLTYKTESSEVNQNILVSDWLPFVMTFSGSSIIFSFIIYRFVRNIRQRNMHQNNNQLDSSDDSGLDTDSEDDVQQNEGQLVEEIRPFIDEIKI